MKKVICAIICAAMAVTLMAPVTVAAEEAADVSGKTIGYYMDAADDYYKCAYEVFMDQVAANEETADCVPGFLYPVCLHCRYGGIPCFHLERE